MTEARARDLRDWLTALERMSSKTIEIDLLRAAIATEDETVISAAVDFMIANGERAKGLEVIRKQLVAEVATHMPRWTGVVRIVAGAPHAPSDVPHWIRQSNKPHWIMQGNKVSARNEWMLAPVDSDGTAIEIRIAGGIQAADAAAIDHVMRGLRETTGHAVAGDERDQVVPIAAALAAKGR